MRKRLWLAVLYGAVGCAGFAGVLACLGETEPEWAEAFVAPAQRPVDEDPDPANEPNAPHPSAAGTHTVANTALLPHHTPPELTAPVAQDTLRDGLRELVAAGSREQAAAFGEGLGDALSIAPAWADDWARLAAEEEDPVVLANLLLALGRAPSSLTARRQLLERFEDTSQVELVRHAALLALAQERESERRAALNPVPGLEDDPTFAAVRFGPIEHEDARAGLLRALADPNRPERERVLTVQALGASQDLEGVGEAFRATYRSAIEPRVRARIVGEVAGRDDPESLALLRLATRDVDPEVRARALLGLPAGPHLASYANDHPLVRRVALLHAADWAADSTAGLSFLLGALRGASDASTRTTVAQALALVGRRAPERLRGAPPELSATLSEMTRDLDAPGREHALTALAALQSGPRPPEERP